MIRVLFFIISLFFMLYANADATAKIAKLLESRDSSDIFSAYNEYKTLYLKSVVEGDESLKKSSLEGIVTSGHRLNIDVSNYELELKNLTSSNLAIKPNANVAKNIKADLLNRLNSVKWDGDKLVFEFSENINSSMVKFSALLEKNQSRYIFDINSAMLTSTHNINHNSVDSIKIAQFNPQTLRVVVQNRTKLELDYKVESNLFIIFFTKDSKKATTSKPASTAMQNKTKIIKNKTIVIDAGHGGDDPGAIGFKKYREKNIVFLVAKELEEMLTSRGYKVFMTRNRDVFVKLSDRTKFANNKGADIFVSIHANAIENKADTKGIETFFLSPSRSDRAKNVAAKENSADLSDMNSYGKDSYLNFLNHHNILASNKLAIDIQRGVLSNLRSKYKDIVDNGVKEGPFWVLVGASMPSILIEVGFVTNELEAQRLSQKTYQKDLATGIANGIDSYFLHN